MGESARGFARQKLIGRRREVTYDDAGRQTGEQWISWPSAIETNRLTFTYDANGNQLTARDYDGAYTMTYDALNRVSTVNDMWGKTLTFTWDAVGNRTQVQDSAGGTTDSTFDALNRLTYRKYTESGTVQLSVTQVYDAASRITEQLRYGTSYSLVARTSITYDAANRLTELKHPHSSRHNTATTQH